MPRMRFLLGMAAGNVLVIDQPQDAAGDMAQMQHQLSKGVGPDFVEVVEAAEHRRLRRVDPSSARDGV